jgi:hypothetical protein
MAPSRRRPRPQKPTVEHPLGGLTPEQFLAKHPNWECTINGYDFAPLPGVTYQNDYRRIALEVLIRGDGEYERAEYRRIASTDLFFLVYFIKGVTGGFGRQSANHPFVVDACRHVQEIEANRAEHRNVLWLWAREHFKSTIITTALNIQRILNNPEITIAVFSHTRPAAKAFLREIKQTFETSIFLKFLFPDVLWGDPEKQAPKWSEDDGIVVNRRSTRKESTVEAWGLLEGMPVGKHFDIRDYDDVSTDQLVESPETILKLKSRYDMSINLGTSEGLSDTVGTTYHHQDVLMYLAEKKDVDGNALYHVSKKPATHDGTPSGKPVLLSERRMKELQANKQHFYSQQLLDPTPQGAQKLNPSLLLRTPRSKLPEKMWKFMTVDPAGVRESDKRDGDAWSIAVFGVSPYLSDVGMSEVYLLELVAEPLGLVEAMKTIVEMYCRHGRVQRLAVEKVGMSMMEVHIQSALKARGKNVTIDNGMLQVVRPEGRSKEQRILGALEMPLLNGKLHIVEGVKEGYLERLYTEMTKFPYWHDDILDGWAYLFDVLRDFRFGRHVPSIADMDWGKSRAAKASGTNSWMLV